MSRTYRRIKKSKNQNSIKNIYFDSIFNNFSWPFIKKKKDIRFFTDNQQTLNFKIATKIMNKKARLEGRLKLSKIQSMEHSEAFILKYYKGKHSFPKQIYLYW